MCRKEHTMGGNNRELRKAVEACALIGALYLIGVLALGAMLGGLFDPRFLLNIAFGLLICWRLFLLRCWAGAFFVFDCWWLTVQSVYSDLWLWTLFWVGWSICVTRLIVLAWPLLEDDI